jgi:tRNA pseudouridine38-40 synthase
MTGAVRLKLIVAYDGGPFRGWQSQSGGNTVQDFLESAFAKICGGEGTRVHGAGRTDAGVHALAQCAHADVARRAPIDWVAALNAHLPREFRVLRCARAAADFHARYSAKGKIYTYRIWNAPVLTPFELGRAWHLPGAPLDIGALKNAAAHFVGTHDFAAFAANRGKPEPDTVRTISVLNVRRKALAPAGQLVTLVFEGDGFLYKMVRLITGALVRVAQGRAEPQWIASMLEGAAICEGGRAAKSSFVAPAEGLYLTRVIY